MRPRERPETCVGAYATYRQKVRGASRSADARQLLNARRSLLQQLAQHVLQNSAVLVVLHLLRSIDAHSRVELHHCAVGFGRAHLHRLTRSEVLQHVSHSDDVERFLTGQAIGFGRLVVEKLQRQDAHAHQVRAMDALEALGQHGAHAEQSRPFRRPVARRT